MENFPEIKSPKDGNGGNIKKDVIIGIGQIGSLGKAFDVGKGIYIIDTPSHVNTLPHTPDHNILSNTHISILQEGEYNTKISEEKGEIPVIEQSTIPYLLQQIANSIQQKIAHAREKLIKIITIKNKEDHKKHIHTQNIKLCNKQNNKYSSPHTSGYLRKHTTARNMK